MRSLLLAPGANALRPLYTPYHLLAAADADAVRVADVLRPTHGWASRTEAAGLSDVKLHRGSPPHMRVQSQRGGGAAAAAPSSSSLIDPLFGDQIDESGGVKQAPFRGTVYPPSDATTVTSPSSPGAASVAYSSYAAAAAPPRHRVQPQRALGFNGALGQPTLLLLPPRMREGGADAAARGGGDGAGSSLPLLFSVGCVAAIIPASEYAAVASATASCVARGRDSTAPGDGASLLADVTLASPFAALGAAAASGADVVTLANPLFRPGGGGDCATDDGMAATSTGAVPSLLAGAAALARFVAARRQRLYCGHDGVIVAAAVHPSLNVIATAQVCVRMLTREGEGAGAGCCPAAYTSAPAFVVQAPPATGAADALACIHLWDPETLKVRAS